ncbi:hypothetical protein [Leptotrichia sp. oral taxon 215]|jgi:hypothetical protein|uniref:hypothetical protein n=1 Tax=Leptotrichia sp. oral taxon 215 TaxID=712359 RepID=UPI00040E03B5|nr:hypothetical protein [Leptotrichia sp. oral taxon 215]DAN25019.1 MAG TPA: hypothetical protein [Caudoviricetes sp.]DAN74521.1 MAG TPA: hypothetical protein [Caudoviricetes sp.]DAY25015.1 MAG TPA: hypothetical protein [Caudoviricetes sp.]DAY31753.1 MAG TPA: hypothetical protein [Caudoviricetes sp.]DAY38170.1 MAG TPA: hypothetical protein [Caudoviricetes sp.]
MNKYKDIRKKMIDKDLTWNKIVEKSSLYTSSWGLRLAIKNNDKKAIRETEETIASF